MPKFFDSFGLTDATQRLSSINSSITNLTSSSIVTNNINFSGSLLNNGVPYGASQWGVVGSAISFTGGNVGIGTTIPNYTLDVAGIIGVTALTGGTISIGTGTIGILRSTDIIAITSISTASLQSTNIVAGTALSTGTIRSTDIVNSSAISTGSIRVSGTTVSTVVSTGNLWSAGGILGATGTIGNFVVTTGLSTGTLNSTNGTIGNFVATTGLSTGTLSSTNGTIGNFVATTGLSTGTLSSTSGTIGNFVATTGLSTGTLSSTNGTIGNFVATTSLSTGTLRVSGTANEVATSTGNLWSAGGILGATGTIGNFVATTGLSTGTLSSTTVLGTSGTIGNFVATTGLSTGTLSSTSGTIGNFVATTGLSTGTLSSTSGTIGNFVATTSLSTGTLRVSGTANEVATSTGNLWSAGGILGATGTIGNLVATTSLTTGALQSSNVIVGTAVSTGALVVSGLSSLVGNSNTIGNIFTTGGNVGIGTSSPLSRVHINGSGTGGTVLVTTGTSTVLMSVLDRIGYQEVTRRDLEIGGLNRDLGNFGGIYKYSFGVNYTGVGQGGDFDLRAIPCNSSSYTSDGTAVSRLYITNTGNVGIGTTTPGQTLTIGGTVGATTTTTGNLWSGTGVFSSVGTIGNFVATTGLSTGTLSSTTVLGTNGTIGNFVATTGLSTGTLRVSGTANEVATSTGNLWSAGGILGATGTIGNFVATTGLSTGTLSSTTVLGTSGTIGNFVATTGLSTGTLSSTTVLGTSGTIGNFVATTSLSTGTLRVSGTANEVATSTGNLWSAGAILGASGTIGNFVATTGLTTGTFIATGITAGNINFTGTLSQNGIPFSSNSSQWGSFGNNISYTSGNVGIGTTSPAFALDVVGAIDSTSLTTGTLNASTGTIGNFVATTSLSSGTLRSTSLITTNSSNTHVSTGSIRATSIAALTFNSNTLGAIVTTGGNVGIGTATPGEKLDLRGNLRVGGGNNANYIAFSGTWDDGLNTFDHTYVGERIYSGTERSELLLFKGNDSDTNSGPDRIRLLASEHRLDTYSGTLSGAFDTIAASGTTRFIVTNSGNVGIGTATPGYLLDVAGAINSVSITTGTLSASTSTIGNFVATTGLTTGTLSASTSTIGNFVATTGLTTGTLSVSNTIVSGDISTGSLIIKTTNAIATISANQENETSTLFLGTPFGGVISNGFKTALIAQGKTSFSRARLHFCLDDTGINGTAYNASLSNSRMMIDSNGNIGIGTTSPAYMLDVAGAIDSLSVTTGNLSAGVATIGNLVATTLDVNGISSAFMPRGGIIMWSGSIVSIPTGWQLCDGTNGTPDLRNRFIIGGGSSYSISDTGGSTTKTLTLANMPAHSHSGTTNNAGGHTHNVKTEFGTTSNLNNTAPNGQYNQISNSLNFINTVSVNAVGDHSHAFTTGSVGSGTAFDIMPPYYALAFIMKL